MQDAEKQLTDIVKVGPHGPPIGGEVIVDVAPEETPHLRDYWNVIFKRRWIVLSTLLIVFFTVAVATLKMKPTYRGMVLVEISPEEPNVLHFQQDILQVSGRDAEAYLQTRYKVLQSRSLAERVVRGLQLYRLPQFYKSSLLFGLIERDPDPIPRPQGNQEVQEIDEAYRNSVRNFLKGVIISPVPRSNLVEVSYNYIDPKLAAQIANRLVSEFIDQNLELKWDETERASEWLSQRLVGLKGRLERSEDSLQEYARRNSILFVGEKRDLAHARLEQLQEELTAAQTERFQRESLYDLVRKGGARDVPGVLANGLIQDLTLQLSELRRKRAELTSILKQDYPTVVQVQNQIDELQGTLDKQRRILVRQVVDEFQVAVNKEEYIKNAVDEQRRTVNSIAEKSIQYNIRRREVETNRQLYDGLLQRLKEAQLSAGLKASNIRIVDSAEVPRSSESPRVLFNLALSLVLGATLGIGLALFREYRDITLQTPEDVEQYLRLPALGLIRHFEIEGNGLGKRSPGPSGLEAADCRALVLRDPGQSVVHEAYCSVRTSILLSGSPAPRCLLVTSPLPKEGKTTTVVNLAGTFASLEKNKVIILDCDMRRPSCHQATGVDRMPGVVQYLTGQMGLSEVIREVPGVPNLSVIPCGPIPPNPADLLSSPAAAELIQRLRSEFHYVLIDSPPLLGVTDSRILAPQVDGVILVVRGNSTPREAIRDARALLSNASARILGITLNNVDLARSGYGYYGYNRYGIDYSQHSEEMPGKDQHTVA